MTTSISTIHVDGVDVFYRHAHPSTNADTAPTILLLHGYPSSSHQYRHLIPILSKTHNVYAPDFPGFGFTNVPETRNYVYTFDNLTNTLEAFIDALKLTKYSLFIFDYGAPTGLRLAVRRPNAVTAIITQNGNAYEIGLGKDFWAPLQTWWASGEYNSPTKEAIGDQVLTFATTKFQYVNGSSNPDKIEPEAYYLDQSLLDRPGNREIQLALFWDYRNNLGKYPEFQKWIRESKVPVLAIWGKNDVIFVKEGEEAYAKDADKEKFELVLVDAGHFAIEGNEELFRRKILGFLEKNTV